MSEVAIVFPEPVLATNISREFSINEKLFVSNMKNFLSENIGNKMTRDSDVLNKIELSNIKKFILEQLKGFITKTINPRYDLKFTITESWMNYTDKGEHHHRHTHPNSIISGVFYFETLNNDNITFHKTPKAFSFDVKEFNVFNSPSWNVPIVPGMLLLFPSYLEHSVPVNKQDKTRISLSFNTWCKGKVSNEHAAKLEIR